jgi:hypothetical protein
MGAGARIAADTRVATLHRKGTEATQLDTVAARQRVGDFVQNGVYDVLDVTKVEMRIAVGDPLNKFGFDHSQLPLRPIFPETSLKWRRNTAKCPEFQGYWS